MHTALVTTTIRTPRVLKLYQAHNPDVGIFIAGDQKTPASCPELCEQQGWTYLSPERQDEFYPPLSAALGWNTIGRRNIALLEALKAGAQNIILVDDDNIPLAPDYFFSFGLPLRHEFNGVQVYAPGGWFDVGQLLYPTAPHRGFPLEVGNKYLIETAVGAQVGVAAGICLGDPDISAITRIARKPIVHETSALLEAGVVVAPQTYTVFNSQNTAFIRALAPCFLMLPQLGRYDDIFASFVAQKVMHKLKMQVHFGKPFVWQQRNQHNLITDLKNETWGYEKFWGITESLRDLSLNDDTSTPLPQRVIEMTGQIYLAAWPLLPDEVANVFIVWMTEMEKIFVSQEKAAA